MDVAMPDFAFADEPAIPLGKYVAAVRGLLPVLGKMGPALRLACTEIEKNVAKVDATGCQSLDGMLECDLANGAYGTEASGSTGLLWSHRALQMVEAILQHLGKGDELSVAAAQGYAETLCKHHGWAVRSLFGLGVKSAPSTATFLSRLGGDSRSTTVKLMDVLRDLRAVNTRVDTMLTATEIRACQRK